jgi:hypothetical protein
MITYLAAKLGGRFWCTAEVPKICQENHQVMAVPEESEPALLGCRVLAL